MDAILALDTLTAPTKPLSPTLSPPPSFSRLPPDGHEFPPNYQEPGHFNVGVPAMIEMNLSPEPILKEAAVLSASPPPLPTSGPPVRKLSQRLDGDVLPPSSPARKFSEDLGSSRPRVPSWRKDEKSERSVKDKIAMFSSSQDVPVRRASKGSSDDIFACDDSDFSDSARKTPSRTPSYRSSLAPQPVSSFGRTSSTIYNSMTDVSSNTALDNGEPPRSLDFNSRTQSSLDLTSSSSSAYSSSGSPDSSLSYGMGYSSTLPRKLGTPRQAQSVSSNKYSDSNEKPVTLSRATSFSGGNTLHTRSQSLVDIGSIPYTSKRNSISSIGGTRPTEDMRRASLNALIEQRRRGISKLRGLVIPEKVAEVSPTQPIIDLPEIKSRDSILATKPPVISPKDDHKSSHRRWSTSTDSSSDRPATHPISTPTWKSQSPAINLPKYSPAFKRKSLAVYGVPSSASSVSSSLSSSREELRPLFDGSNTQKPPPPLPPSKPPRQFVGNFTQSYGSSLLSKPEPPKSLESITSPTRSDMSFEFVSSCGSSPDLRISAPVTMKDEPTKKINNGHITNGNIYMNGSKTTRLSPTGKILSSDNGRSEDDSDNDSAVSSSRSSISHDFSPPASPLPDNRTATEDSQRHHTLHASILSPSNTVESRPLRRTLSSETTASIASSTTSTLTSGSQASCSSNGGSSSGSDSKRVLKAQSVEAINRKNVLSSARYSSGKDYKIGSPLIQRKFEEDKLKQNLLSIPGDLPQKETIVSHSGEDSDIQCKKISCTGKLYEISNNATETPAIIAKEVLHYTATDLEDVPNENSVLYFEVQETEVFDEPDNADDTVIEVSDKTSNSVPLPAPRHSNSQTPVKSNSATSVDEVSIPSDRWAELTKKYSKNQESLNDEVDRVPIANNQFLSKPTESEQITDGYSSKNFKMKEFTLDLKNQTLVLNSKEDKSDDDMSSSDNSPTSPVGSYSSGKTIENPVSPPAVPPKPVQRRNMQNESPAVSDKRESELMTILTGKSRDQTPLQLRERRRSKDLDSLRPISMTIERSVSSEEVLPNGGLRTIKTVENYQETISSPTNKMPTAAMRHGSNRRSVSVNDIRKAFEKAELALANTGRANGTKTSSVITSSNGIAIHHARVSSLDSTTSDDSYAAIPGYCGSVSTLQKEQFGSVTSIASSTSLISQQASTEIVA
ncbi:hypothetical protein PR048_014565 [Dryococelus australis]|uniref:Uncharacterized protein n=1 Tax=Dryococelus australis TaxID=614101 RepID=A0ABQ9HEK8_9NEOP|nr:hypothetical protein PR048_014565 [Dryococelus australis]